MKRTVWKYVRRILLAAAFQSLAVAATNLLALGTSAPPIGLIAEALAQTPVSSETPPGESGVMSAPTTTPGDQAVTAAEPPSPVGDQTSTEPKEQEEPTFVDIMHGGISHSILSTATWMDSFFGDKRYASELNTSYIRFGYNVYLEKGTGPQLKRDWKLRVVLPQLREKTHLVISGVPKEENEFAAVNSSTATEDDQFARPGDRGVTTALHYVPVQTMRSNFTMRVGLKLHRAGPILLFGPRYRILFPFENGWSLRLVEDLAWRSDTDWLSRSTVDLERPIPWGLFFRTSTEWVHTEHVDGYVYSYSCVIRQPLSMRRALEYEWINIFQTEPVNELEEVDLRIHFRRNVWRNWFYFEVVPQYRFPRSRSFEATPGILFRLETIFGSYT